MIVMQQTIEHDPVDCRQNVLFLWCIVGERDKHLINIMRYTCMN